MRRTFEDTITTTPSSTRPIRSPTDGGPRPGTAGRRASLRLGAALGVLALLVALPVAVVALVGLPRARRTEPTRAVGSARRHRHRADRHRAVPGAVGVVRRHRGRRDRAGRHLAQPAPGRTVGAAVGVTHRVGAAAGAGRDDLVDHRGGLGAHLGGRPRFDGIGRRRAAAGSRGDARWARRLDPDPHVDVRRRTPSGRRGRDTPYSVAVRLGDASLRDHIIELNRGRTTPTGAAWNGGVFPDGMHVVVPDGSLDHRLQTWSAYEVIEGDSVYRIAARLAADGGRVRDVADEIIERNIGRADERRPRVRRPVAHQGRLAARGARAGEPGHRRRPVRRPPAPVRRGDGGAHGARRRVVLEHRRGPPRQHRARRRRTAGGRAGRGDDRPERADARSLGRDAHRARRSAAVAGDRGGRAGRRTTGPAGRHAGDRRRPGTRCVRTAAATVDHGAGRRHAADRCDAADRGHHHLGGTGGNTHRRRHRPGHRPGPGPPGAGHHQPRSRSTAVRRRAGADRVAAPTPAAPCRPTCSSRTAHRSRHRRPSGCCARSAQASEHCVSTSRFGRRGITWPAPGHTYWPQR